MAAEEEAVAGEARVRAAVAGRVRAVVAARAQAVGAPVPVEAVLSSG